MNIKWFSFNRKGSSDLKCMENMYFLSNPYLPVLMDGTDRNEPSNQEPVWDFEIHYHLFPEQIYHPTCSALKLMKICLFSTSAREGSTNSCWIAGRKQIWK